MRLLNFRARAHVSERRIDICWEIYPEPDETLDGTVPAVQVRRKTRDFMYPPAVDGDPFLIYDGATFSADRTLAPRFEIEAGYRVKEVVEADEIDVQGETVLVPRRWIRTYFDESETIHHIQVCIADRSAGDAGLRPGTVCYYQIFGDLVPTHGAPASYRATAQITALVNFCADAQASGGQIDISWEIHPGTSVTLDDTLPAVQVRRKTRDFMYPPAVDGDPFLIYDGETFSADRTLATLFEIEAGYRVTEVVEADEVDVEGETVLVPRRWTRTYFDDGKIHHLLVRIADRGDGDAGLTPGTVYYYQVFGDLVPTGGNMAPYRAVAQAAASYGMGDQLYRLLPDIHQRYDEKGELRRFLSLFGDQLDLMRSLAEGLPGLHDVDNCDHRVLPLMADWTGWDLNFAAPIPIRRHEIKYAAALYRITGTIPGCMIWVKRLTGWDARPKEFYHNVFFTNDLGNPDDPTDHGSHTVDISDPDLLANIGKSEDDLDYTYDTGTSDEDWYAYNAVGLFVRPAKGETVATVLRKKANLVNNLALFMPVNIRGIVILETDTTTDVRDETMGLLEGTTDETP